MMIFSLTNHSTVAFILRISASLLTGALVGAFHFLSLKWNVRMLADGRVLLPIGFQLFQFAVLGSTLAVIVRSFGPMPLLAATTGLLMARTAVIRRGAQP